MKGAGVEPQRNTLYYGDNLDILRKEIRNQSIDLIYLDPPFNSKADYNILFREATGDESTAQIQAFSDFWHWDKAARDAYNYLTSNDVDEKIANLSTSLFQLLGKNDLTAYLFIMAERLVELHRVLKSSGSLYLHCDPTASHYLKILLDSIFDPTNFRNEVIWRRTGAHGSRKGFGPIHDVLLFYTKTSSYFFKTVKRPYMKGHVQGRYTTDASGRQKFSTGGNILTGSGATGGQSGMAWRGFNPSAKNRHWAIPGFLTNQMPPTFKTLGVLDKLEYLHNQGLIEIKEGTEWPTPVRYLQEEDGRPLQDVWAYQPYTEGTVFGTKEGIDHDVSWLGPTDPERLGYQTQKPVGLLERIIRSSCPDDGVVLDPFCGCGTTIIAAEKLSRLWIGIDITFLAINLVRQRLGDAFPSCEFQVVGEPRDLGAANELSKNRYQFQCWALTLIGARPVGSTLKEPETVRKGADEGVDGWLRFSDGPEGHIERVAVQVKSGHVSVKDIREFRDVVSRQKAAIGIFLTLSEPTSEMVKEMNATDPYVSPRYHKEYPKLQILTIEGLFKGKRPEMPPAVSPFQEAPVMQKSDNLSQSRLLPY